VVDVGSVGNYWLALNLYFGEHDAFDYESAIELLTDNLSLMRHVVSQGYVAERYKLNIAQLDAFNEHELRRMAIVRDTGEVVFGANQLLLKGVRIVDKRVVRSDMKVLKDGFFVEEFCYSDTVLGDEHRFLHLFEKSTPEKRTVFLPRAALKPVEIEIIGHLQRGLNLKETADAMRRSLNGVRYYWDELKKTLKVSHPTEVQGLDIRYL